MKPGDSLDLVELNESFVRQLEEQFRNDPHFQPVAERSRIINSPVQDLPLDKKVRSDRLRLAAEQFFGRVGREHSRKNCCNC